MTDQAKLEKPHQRENRTLHRPRHNVGVSACAYLPLDGNSTWRSTRPTTALCEQFHGGDEETDASNFLTPIISPLSLVYLFSSKNLEFSLEMRKKCEDRDLETKSGFLFETYSSRGIFESF